MTIRGKKISIIGLGETGIASAEVLASTNEVTIFDHKEVPIPPQLKNLPLKFHLGDPLYQGAEEADLIIISPGVSPNQPFVKRALALNVPIRSEIEIAYQLCPAPIIAITGTDGKSTTTSLTAHILQTAGKKAIALGNIGSAFIRAVPHLSPEDIVVLEVSSFQLEWIERFHPHIGVLLNISGDHLERYPSLEAYAKTKMRLFENQSEEDFAILNADDPLVYKLSQTLPSYRLYFSLTPLEEEGAFAKEGRIYIRLQEKGISFPIPSTQLEGIHNLQNILASSLVAFLMGISPEHISEGISTFQPLEHRMERVDCIDGVLFVNDSKATNPHAASKALSSFPPPIILIAGGKLKERTDYTTLFRGYKSKLKAVLLIGESAFLLEEIARETGIENIYRAKDLTDAVRQAFSISSPGDTILLSPACASFDMFRDFEERGRCFKEIVRSLRKERQR